MEEAFQVAIPLVGNIRADISTLLSGLILLGFIILGMDYIRAMMSRSAFEKIESERISQADFWETDARDEYESRNEHAKGTFEWMKHDMSYKHKLRKSVQLRNK